MDGYRYGFLQPFNNQVARLAGQTFTLLLYTKRKGHTFLAARIERAFVPWAKELKDAVGRMESAGWLHEMRLDVESVGGNVLALAANDPQLIVNVRFRPADATIYDPMTELPRDSKPFRTKHYVLFEPNGDEDWSEAVRANTKLPDDRERPRIAQQATIIDPRHTRLQNRLYTSLCDQYGKSAVDREKEYVDLRLTTGGEVTFFEIKMDDEPKECIRNALGQLLEYSTYPDVSKANRWVVVGVMPPTADDQRYLEHLRTKYRLPIYYCQFAEGSAKLTEPV